jgi:hypothetical protein
VGDRRMLGSQEDCFLGGANRSGLS